jgi:hypothetical protein
VTHIPASIRTMTARSAPSNSFAGAGREAESSSLLTSVVSEAQTIVIATPAARAQACVTRFRTMFPLQIGGYQLRQNRSSRQIFGASRSWSFAGAVIGRAEAAGAC